MMDPVVRYLCCLLAAQLLSETTLMLVRLPFSLGALLLWLVSTAGAAALLMGAIRG